MKFYKNLIYLKIREYSPNYDNNGEFWCQCRRAWIVLHWKLGYVICFDVSVNFYRNYHFFDPARNENKIKENNLIKSYFPIWFLIALIK